MTVTRVISCLALGLSLCAQTAVAKTAVPECAAQSGEQRFELDAFDLGRGMTAFLESRGPEGANIGTSLVVLSCHTGRYVEATVWTGKESDPTTYPETLEIFEDASTENAIVTFEGLAKEFAAAEIPVISGISRFETCICAVQYPGLRGTKQGFAQK